MLNQAAIERVESELDSLINKRARGREKANELEKFWKDSESKYRERIQRENRARWFAFYSHLADSFRQRAADYERKAEELCLEEGG